MRRASMIQWIKTRSEATTIAISRRVINASVVEAPEDGLEGETTAHQIEDAERP